MSEEVKEDVAVEATEEETTDEATKMLSEAMQKAMEAGDKVAVAKLKAAQDAVADMIDSVTAVAKAKTVVAEVTVNKASFDVDGVTSGIRGLSEKQGKGSFVFKFKDANELGYLEKGTDRTDLTGDVIAPDHDTEISIPVTRRTFLEDIARVIPTESDTVKYTEVYNTTGAPASTAELATIPQVDRKFRVVSKGVEKISAISKHSIELMKYGPELVAVLRNMLSVDMKVVTEDQLLSGNGTSPQIQGILGVAEELDATAIGTLRIASANRFDAIRAAVAKIMVAGEGTYMPNIILINPIDGLMMDTEKDDNGAYVLPPFKTADGQLIKNVRVLETVAIAEGDFLIGDFSKMIIRPKGGYEVEFSDSDGDDFSNDIMAIKMRRFLTSVIKNNDSGAFLRGTFDDVIAALIAA